MVDINPQTRETASPLMLDFLDAFRRSRVLKSEMRVSDSIPHQSSDGLADVSWGDFNTLFSPTPSYKHPEYQRTSPRFLVGTIWQQSPELL